MGGCSSNNTFKETIIREKKFDTTHFLDDYQIFRRLTRQKIDFRENPRYLTVFQRFTMAEDRHSLQNSGP